MDLSILKSLNESLLVCETHFPTNVTGWKAKHALNIADINTHIKWGRPLLMGISKLEGRVDLK